jgi:hypothetical protein
MEKLQTIWQYIQAADVLIGIGTFIFSIFIWTRVRQTTKQIREFAAISPTLNAYEDRVKHHEAIRSEKPIALCLALAENTISIKPDVERFLKSKSMKMPVIELQKQGLLSIDIGKYISELRQIRQKELAGSTEIHLFYYGPVIGATLVGAALDNWIPVKLYHHHRDGRYEYWGLLEK